MPRVVNDTAALIHDLKSRLERLTEVARQEGRAQALSEIRSLVGGTAPAAAGPGRPRGTSTVATRAKPDGRQNSWSRMTPAARLARVNAIRKGKGLPPKAKL
jgi:hypothetical protein